MGSATSVRADGKGPQDEFEPDRRAPGADILHGQAIGVAVLETKELLVRGASRRCNDAEAQARADPGGPGIAAEALRGVGGSAPAAIDRPLSRTHPSDDVTRPCTASYSAGAEPHRPTAPDPGRSGGPSDRREDRTAPGGRR
jgi:hypothetical protein